MSSEEYSHKCSTAFVLVPGYTTPTSSHMNTCLAWSYPYEIAYAWIATQNEFLFTIKQIYMEKQNSSEMHVSSNWI